MHGKAQANAQRTAWRKEEHMRESRGIEGTSEREHRRERKENVRDPAREKQRQSTGGTVLVIVGMRVKVRIYTKIDNSQPDRKNFLISQAV